MTAPDSLTASPDRLWIPPDAAGAWVAYHLDWSGAVLFATELEALRHAVDHSMHAAFWRFGQDMHEAGLR